MLLRRLFPGLCLFLILVAPAGAWWNGDWTVRRKIVIDPAAVGIAEPVGAAPVLIRLFDGNFNFGAAKEDGSDLRFVAGDDKTVLPHHVERYDALLNEAFVWVRVPDLKPGTKTEIWLYAGNAGPRGAKAEDSKATYDAETTLVFHFSEKGAPASDASGNGNSAQAAGTPVAGALIAGGLRLDGRSRVSVAASSTLAWTAGGTLTWSAWIKPAALAANAVFFQREENGASLTLGLDQGVPYVEFVGAGGPLRSVPVMPFAANAWRHLALVCQGGRATLYIDGEARPELAAALPALNAPLQLGAAEGGFAGEIDELQIARDARSAGWLRFAALNQGGEREKAALLVAVGAEEAPKSWINFGGEFGIIVRNLTVDGWIVIVICAGMAVGSWVIMVRKAGYLNSMKRGNEAFLRAWSEAADDLTTLDSNCAQSMSTLGGKIAPEEAREMRHASIYRIYHIGAEEVRKRVGNGHGSVLSGRSMQAIKASLDGGMVRETQKLNRLMVLLTICISGGPFLGLLGTVVGVMITFAAIAAAGDVNVNAIAPGIAAALLATIAGLAVAIPALFGYNYLLSRIKETTSDMAVFIDEFVARMAEFYGGREEA